MSKDLDEEISVSVKRNRIVMYTKTLNDYNTLLEKIKAAQIQFHTYTLQDQKPLTSILEGLAPNITEEEVKKDLESQGSKNIVVKQLSSKTENEKGKFDEVKLPIFSIKFEPQTKISDLNKERFVCYCKVHWEKQISKKTLVTQCYKCQVFGHIAKNCFRIEKCGVCAGAHNTKECIVDNVQNYKCANCDGNHMAVKRVRFIHTS